MTPEIRQKLLSSYKEEARQMDWGDTIEFEAAVAAIKDDEDIPVPPSEDWGIYDPEWLEGEFPVAVYMDYASGNFKDY